ncbi:hypothetical protein NLJ89_g12138 [Agrocybe chaxingu]|uniref:Uncharacterized protein n=1 Tax=Agrocybe chaxingu TaxID=84603 RepID=A0A9W8JMF3_9AGAR|nr:hypothetical protein NLJ89_g12138 [Agrocybe chaxingu]
MPQPPTSVSTSRAASAAGGAPSIALLGAGPVPRTGSVGSRHARRRQSGDSSSSASTMPMDMLQFPSESERDRLRDRELSVIHEAEDGSTVRGASPIPAGPPGGPVPTWMTHPPVDHARAEMEAMRSATPRAGPNVEGWRSGIGNGPPSTGSSTYRANPYQQAPNPDFLAPNYPPSLSRRPSNASSGSDYNITIEPPSGPPSSIDNQEADRTGSFLSPNHAPISLPQIQPSQPRRHTPGSHGTPVLPVRPPIRSPYDFDTSGIPTAPNSPVQSAAVSGGMPIVLDGPPPPGFIPQMITDNRGVSTPLTGWTGLPGMGGPGMPGPTGPPVIPRSASRASTDSEPPIWNGPGERPLYGPKGNRLDIKKPGGPTATASNFYPDA